MKRILLVEDDLDIRPILETILRGNGCQVDAVATAAAAKGLLKRQPYDLVIADWRLPDGSGFKIADQAAAQGIPRFVISGYLFQADKTDLNRHEHMMKPVRPTALLKAAHRAIGQAHA